MNLLLIHQNFPGQFRHIATDLAKDRNNVIVAVGEKKKHSRDLPRVRHVWYPEPKGGSRNIHRYLRRLDSHVRRGQVLFRELMKLKGAGYEPDLICAHAGWGEALYLREVYPDVPVLGYFEFYYHATGADVGFDPEFPASIDDAARVRTINATNLLSLEVCDRGLTPTEWQRSLFPERYRDMITVIHEGVDTDGLRPDPGARAKLPDGTVLTTDQEVITFVSRNLEPYRGFHIFMRALPGLLASRPKAHVVIVGGEERGYGREAPQGTTYRRMYTEEIGLDEDGPDAARVHFTGRVPHNLFVNILQVSSAHVYLTYPFVLSWSMLEAMSCGCLVIGSATPSVTEVLRHEENGLLVNFFKPREVVDAVNRALDNPGDMEKIRRAAREAIVAGYDLKSICLPAQREFLREMAGG